MYYNGLSRSLYVTKGYWNIRPVIDMGTRRRAMIVGLHCSQESDDGSTKRNGLSSVLYLLLKAPRSAKSASTPVKASKIPPSDFQPSVLFRTR